MKCFVFIVMLMNMIFVTQNAMADAHHEIKKQHASHHAVSKKINTASVDINHATTDELITLKGLGSKKAAAIIAYRKAHGDFQSVNDLAKVHGIGAKAVARLIAKNSGRILVNKQQNMG